MLCFISINLFNEMFKKSSFIENPPQKPLSSYKLPWLPMVYDSFKTK